MTSITGTSLGTTAAPELPMDSPEDDAPSLDDRFDSFGNYSRTEADGEGVIQINSDGGTSARSFGDDPGVAVRDRDGNIAFGELAGPLQQIDFDTVATFLGDVGARGAEYRQDTDGNGTLDASATLNADGTITLVNEERGSGATIDAEGNYASFEADGSTRQNNVDGSFVDIEADGSSMWRTSDGEIGQTVIDDHGGSSSVARNPDGTGGRVLGDTGAPVEVTLATSDASEVDTDAGAFPDDVNVTELGGGNVAWTSPGGDSGFVAADGSGFRINADADGDPGTAAGFYSFGEGGAVETWRTEDGAAGAVTGDVATYVDDHGGTRRGPADDLLSAVAPELLDPGFLLGESA